MKRTTLYLALAAVLACGCAKTPSAGLNDADKRYFDAWMQVNHPDARPTALGAYVVSETAGTGTAAGSADSHPYVRVEYAARALDGTVQTTTQADLARRLGTYSERSYYGPVVWVRSDNGLTAGMEEAVSGMNVGGTKSVILPGWLQTTDRYATADEYLKNVSGTAMMYDLKLVDAITDIKKWETDSVGRYVERTFPGKAALDSLKYGFYYFRTGAPSSDKAFPEDTTIYINYVGRLLNGTVFDTNVKDTAKFYGLYSAGRDYSPSKVSWYSADGKYSDIKMGGSSIIDGFAYALYQMHPHEKGTAVFYSGSGYGDSGSGSSIPAFAPLRFDIEIVNEP